MKLVSTFSERLREILELKDIKPSKLAELVDINKSTISQYLNGEYEPKRNRIELFAKTLNVNEAWLIGYDVEMTRDKQAKREEKSNIDMSTIINGDEFAMIPLYNSISAGYGSEETEFLEMIGIPGLKNPQECFAVRVKGDSMEDKIEEGSIIIVRRDTIIENGEIGAFSYNEKPYVKQKKVYGNTVVLRSYNNNYKDLVVDEAEEFKEYGKVVMAITKF